MGRTRARANGAGGGEGGKSPMKILVVHNFYQQAGGEDVVFRNETDLLRARGHDVIEFTAHNDAVSAMGKTKLAANTIWSREYRRKLAGVIAEAQPDIAHFHNTFMVISPSAYYAARDAGIPVIQTLHNYRLFCLNATFYRDGRVCEDCAGKLLPYPGIVHGCYRDSKVISGVVAGMLTTHRLLGTYQRAIDSYIVLTAFARQKFAELGLPADKLHLKTNFLKDDPGLGARDGGYALFVGRLTEEKGVRLMLDAWRAAPDIPLKVVGDGPLLEMAQTFVAQHKLAHVEILGRKPREETLRLMGGARALVFPSGWYEGMPMTIIEAFACGLPVLAARLGSMATVVEHERTGLHFRPGDAGDLAAQARRLWGDPALTAQLGAAARGEFERHYTADENYAQLMRIYTDARDRARNRDRAATGSAR
jgi:glycosyltransferase involved in cell wall biosynthesis